MTAPKHHKDKVNWQEAMYNEAEASDNAQWAKETKRTALLQPVRDAFKPWLFEDGHFISSSICMFFLFLLANITQHWFANLLSDNHLSSLLILSATPFMVLLFAGTLLGIVFKKESLFAHAFLWLNYNALTSTELKDKLNWDSIMLLTIITTALFTVGFWSGQQLRLKLKI